jgi:hypothetical protein
MLFGGCFGVLVQRYPSCLRLVLVWYSVSPDACDNNLMEEHCTLCGNVTIAMRSVLVSASQVVEVSCGASASARS